MDVLKSNKDYIASCMNIGEIAEVLKYHDLIDDEEKLAIQAVEDSKGQMSKLLDTIDGKNHQKAAYTICDVIRNSYPSLSVNIPDIQLDLRLKVPLGNLKILKIALFDDRLGIDIREHKVSDIENKISFTKKLKTSIFSYKKNLLS